MRIAINELKRGLSRYLAQARKGQTIEVTSHDKLVARIVGIPPGSPDGLARLLSTNAAEWGGGKPAFEPPVRLEAGGKPVSEIVREERS